MESPKIQRALISVSDKLGLVDFARGLAAAGVEIYSTGGTRRHLEQAGVAVRDIAQYTGVPEMLDGRLKTLHPKVFGGILCRHDRPDDMAAIQQHGIVTFELVVVNLYPFAATIARSGVQEQEAIEQIDIGGPSLVRAAAKNHAFVTVVTDPQQYSAVLDQVASQGCTTPELRRRLMAEAFAHTAQYDRVIADYFARSGSEETFPQQLTLTWRRRAELRYGENPHQQAALYAESEGRGPSVVTARQLHGKQLSYNNLLDLDSALAMVRSLASPAVVVIKHNNPCGAAEADQLAEAARRALDGDPLSAFGSVLGINATVDRPTAELLATPGLFIEAIVAPDFEPEAIEILTTRPKWKKNVRLMQVGRLDQLPTRQQLRFLEGGLLVQDADIGEDPQSEWRVVTEVGVPPELHGELRFGWAIVRHVKSNAITLSKDRALCGVGAGQMSRVDSVRIAIEKAGQRARGCVLASDAFFPFPDSIEKAAEAGIAAIIQPGGSRNDEEVIAACNARNMPMIFTGRRHFKH